MKPDKYLLTIGVVLLVVAGVVLYKFHFPELWSKGRLGEALSLSAVVLVGLALVAFLDVQGQRDKFRELQLPKNPEEAAAVGEVLRQTAAVVPKGGSLIPDFRYSEGKTPAGRSVRTSSSRVRRRSALYWRGIEFLPLGFTISRTRSARDQ